LALVVVVGGVTTAVAVFVGAAGVGAGLG